MKNKKDFILDGLNLIFHAITSDEFFIVCILNFILIMLFLR